MADNSTKSLYDQFNQKNMSELYSISQSETATPEEKAMANRLLRERSEREARQEKENKQYQQQLQRQQGSYELAHGGMVHRGRKAGLSAEKAG